jgi:hypothetical protein
MSKPIKLRNGVEARIEAKVVILDFYQDLKGCNAVELSHTSIRKMYRALSKRVKP